MNPFIRRCSSREHPTLLLLAPHPLCVLPLLMIGVTSMPSRRSKRVKNRKQREEPNYPKISICFVSKTVQHRIVIGRSAIAKPWFGNPVIRGSQPGRNLDPITPGILPKVTRIVLIPINSAGELTVYSSWRWGAHQFCLSIAVSHYGGNTHYCLWSTDGTTPDLRLPSRSRRYQVILLDERGTVWLHLTARWPGVELATCWLHVPRPNYYSTEPHIASSLNFFV